ncbi:MAG TPA: hypothetical protein VLK84_19505 [Longimicrobium sp.]|nr:hypothetical protein [Longimicrobium sp.]
MSEEWTDADDAIEEIREIRRQIWARFDNDPEKLMAHYIERDKQYVGPRIAPRRREQLSESSRDAADEQDMVAFPNGGDPPATGE